MAMSIAELRNIAKMARDEAENTSDEEIKASCLKRATNVEKRIIEELLAASKKNIHKLTKSITKKIKILGSEFSFEQWLKWANTLYPITEVNGVFTVTSVARSWQDEKTWSFNSKTECEEKILDLIDYKITDRNRGSGDMEKDLAAYMQGVLA